ncbi:MAG: Fic family protein [Gemmatimonadales bacterium]
MSISSMEPMLPSDSGLETQASEVVSAAERLGGTLHPLTLAAVADLLRTVNCYYSNLIEGHNTHPADIERAMREDYSQDSGTRDLQREARAHIEVQRLMDARLDSEPELDVCSASFLRWIHREFYERLPGDFRIVRDPGTGREEPVRPGEFRHHDVKVGMHVPLPANRIEAAILRFAEAYDPVRFVPASGMVAAGAAHHRLLWIHPFGDGNGRVTRLMTDAYLRRIGVGGNGLWSVSRGLARRRDEYRRYLAAADDLRRDDHDGRGNLSNSALVDFVRFFLEVCADQIEFMAHLLEIDMLANRFLNYARAIPLRKEAVRLLMDLLYRGMVPRGEVTDLLKLHERTARRVLRELVDDGWIESESSRAPLRLRIPTHAVPYVLPDLYGV